MIWGNDSANDSNKHPVSFHNLKQTATWGNQMHYGEQTREGPEILWKCSRKLAGRPQWKLPQEAQIKNSSKLKFRECRKSNMLSQFQILLKKNSGQENISMVSWYLEALRCFVEVGVENTKYGDSWKKKKNHTNQKAQTPNLKPTNEPTNNKKTPQLS